MTETAIRAEALCRTFGRVTAVNDLSLEVPAGIVFGFLGPNGAGKTTMIRLLLGLLEPTRGRASVLGFDTREQARLIRDRTGALLEHSGLYERMTAEDNLEFYGRVWRMSAPERRDRTHVLLTHLGLWERRKEQVRTWSRGMKQKLAVARTLFHRPSLVFLDEPTAGLDPVASAALREDLHGLVKREGITVFLTTHNLSEAEKLCARVGVISRGRLLALGTPDELGRRGEGSTLVIRGSAFNDQALHSLRALPEVKRVELEDSELMIETCRDAGAAPMVRLLVDAGAEIEEVRRSKASLEEMFLKLVAEESQDHDL
ncbi:MAG: ABC transporter ATP-binding protein [Planctomycetota bacterium]